MAQSNAVEQPKTQVKEEALVGVISDAVRRKGLRKQSFKIRVTDKAIILIPETSPGEKTTETPTRIELDQIKSVSLTPGRSYKNCCEKLIEENGSLEIVSTGGKYSFSLPSARAEKAQAAFRYLKLIK